MPGITRRAFDCATAKLTIKGLLIGGRVHAVVGRGVEVTKSCPDSNHFLTSNLLSSQSIIPSI
jgi:hypothetical protein